MENHRIIIFDGVCNFCNGAVRFIMNRDSEEKFLFTPMQSDLAKELIIQHQINNVGIDTFLLIKNGKSYIWTDAAMEIAKELSGFWYLFNIFRIIPSSVRDYFYRLFARNRYKLFGRTDECVIPTKSIRKRFIGV